MPSKKFRIVNKFKGKRRKKANDKDSVVGNKVNCASLTNFVERCDAADVNNGYVANTSFAGASSTKLSKFEEKPYNIADKKESGYRIVEFSFLENLVASLACASCKGNNLFLKENKQQGLASFISVSCLDCLQIKQFTTSHRLPNKATLSCFEINRLAVAAFRDIGCGQAASQSWFATMNIPISLHKKTFAKHSKVVSSAAVKTADDVLKEAASIVRQQYILNDRSLANETILNISVSFDGTWHRRGHRSHYGVGIVTELLTGLVLDYQVMSSYCFECQKNKKKCKDNEKWLCDHQIECNKNFSGSANAMESAAACTIWNRSIEKHKLRYTVFLGDGDSKTFHDITEAKPYGDIGVIKEECINHVSKRMGTALKNLVIQCRADGTPISGKGKLTQERILRLQNYYGKAIKSNSNDLQAMKNAVWAVLFHSVSTDEEPHHTRCPTGETSWCWWQRWQATGIHPSRTHRNPIPKSVGEKLVPIFQRLGGEELLKRCLQGKTQNNNECVNSMIWQKCPKVRFAGFETVNYAVARAVSVFNKGAVSSLDMAKKMGISLTVHHLDAAQRRDSERVKKSEEQSTDKQKKARKAYKLEKARSDDKQQSKEGSTYDPGAF